MKSVDVFALSTPPAFLTDTDAANYWQERLACELSNNFFLLAANNFAWTQPEDADLTSWETTVDAWGASLEAWYTSAVAASSDGLPIPAPPSLPALPGGTLPSIIISVILKIAIRTLVDWLRKRLDPSTDVNETADVLRQAMLKSLPETPDEYFSILEVLADAGLHITINQRGDYEDIHFE